MNKKIEDYLHLYLGGELMYLNKVHKFCGSSIDGSGEVFVHLLRDKIYFVNLLHEHGEMQLILRPLSDMSEEETRYWANIYLTSDNDQEDKIEQSAEETRYLLSKHFDLFNLIPEGLAIDKTTLK